MNAPLHPIFAGILSDFCASPRVTDAEHRALELIGPICPGCGKSCEVITADFGYGHTEYWGAGSSHSDVRTVSRCCHEDVNGGEE